MTLVKIEFLTFAKSELTVAMKKTEPLPYQACF